MSIHTYDLPGIQCDGCAEKVMYAVSQLPLKDCTFAVDTTQKKLTLKFKSSADIKALDAVLLPVLEATGKREKQPHGFWGALGLASGAFLMLFPLFFPAMPWGVWVLLGSASSALTLFLGRLTYRDAYRAMRQRIFGMEMLLSVSTVILLGVSVAALFVPGLPIMFEVGPLVFGFRRLGLFVRERLISKLPKVPLFQDSVPQKVLLESGEQILLRRVKVGDRILLSAGDKLPVDGQFQSGRAMLCRSCETGEDDASEPLRLKKTYVAGTEVLAVTRGPLVLKATQTANDSYLAAQDKAVLNLKLTRALDKTNLNRRMKSWLNLFVPAVFLFAVCSAVFVGLYFSSWMTATQCVVSELLAACPCTSGIIVPLVTQAGVQKLKAKKLTVRVPEDLEVAAGVNAAVFDLNGTLTHGLPQLVREKSDLSVLPFIAYLEKDKNHRIARGIQAAAAEYPDYVPSDIFQAQSEHIALQGGFTVRLGEDEYALGNQALMENLGVENLDVCLGARETRIYLAKNGGLEGHLTFESQMRPGAKQVIQAFQAAGVPVYVATGTEKNTAMSHLSALGIPESHVFAGCSIEEKKNILDNLRANGKQVAAFGDGLNDALMLGSSDFSVAVGCKKGHEGIQGSASAVLASESLLPVLDLFQVARDTRANIYQNIGFNVAYSALTVLAPVGLFVALGTVVNPAVWPALMLVPMVLTLGNIYRFSKTAIASNIVTQAEKPVRADITSSPRQKLELVRTCRPEPTHDLGEGFQYEEGSATQRLVR